MSPDTVAVQLTTPIVQQLVPHGFCLAQDPFLITIDALSNLIIAVAYAWIAAKLFGHSTPFRRHALAASIEPLMPPERMKWMAASFGTFIFWCGCTHMLDVVTLWWPLYYFDAVVRLVTASVSFWTACIFAAQVKIT